MVNKSMRCTTTAAESAAARVPGAASGDPTISQTTATEQIMTTQAAGKTSSAACAIQPAAEVGEGSHGGAPRGIEDYDLQLVYSGESDDDMDS